MRTRSRVSWGCVVEAVLREAAMTDTLYELELEERIRTSSVEVFQVILGFFDCSRLRERNVELIRMLREELARRDGSAR